MMSASFSVVLTVRRVIGSCARKRKTRLRADTEMPELCWSSASLTRSIALAARPHSIDSASVELVLCGPCRRLAHSIKKEVPLDPVNLTLST